MHENFNNNFKNTDIKKINIISINKNNNEFSQQLLNESNLILSVSNNNQPNKQNFKINSKFQFNNNCSYKIRNKVIDYNIYFTELADEKRYKNIEKPFDNINW
jgi:hypothetical protein